MPKVSAELSHVMQVFYDGACPLCSRNADKYMARDTLKRIEWVDVSRPDSDVSVHGLDAGKLQREMHAKMKDGKVVTGVSAFIKIWELLPPRLGTTILMFLLRIPGFLALAGVFYRLFARNRYRLTGRCPPEGCAIARPK